jgi:hypothetical protein
MKRPSFQFYPADWLRDPSLRACSLAARGLWMDMISYMHEARPYGHLTLPSVAEDGCKDTLRPILPNILARMVGGSANEVEGLLAELEAAGVFSRTQAGTIFSRRMVNDEKLREIRANGGIQSLNNPNVPRPKNSRKDTVEGSLGKSIPVSFEGSPSSSSSKNTMSDSKNTMSEPEIGSDPANGSTQKKAPTAPSRQAAKLTALLKAEIRRNKPDYRITPTQERNWTVTAQRMLDIDKRTPDQIEKLIRWVQHDEFWMPNVLSMNALREKFDQLELKAGAQAPKAAVHVPLPANYVSASEKILQERGAGGMQ